LRTPWKLPLEKYLLVEKSSFDLVLWMPRYRAGYCNCSPIGAEITTSQSTNNIFKIRNSYCITVLATVAQKPLNQREPNISSVCICQCGDLTSSCLTNVQSVLSENRYATKSPHFPTSLSNNTNWTYQRCGLGSSQTSTRRRSNT